LGVLVRFVFWQIMSVSSFFVWLFLLGFWGVDELGYSFCALWAVYVVALLVLWSAGKCGAFFRYYATAWTYPRWRLANGFFDEGGEVVLITGRRRVVCFCLGWLHVISSLIYPT
jgi:hypothetical protein